MIVGSGLIAKAFKDNFSDDDRILIFASGVSNSNTCEKEDFLREKSLILKLKKNNQNKIFVYFSSCDIGNMEELTSYYQHKVNMETLITKTFKKYYIFRLPQVVGNTCNKNTLLNFLFFKIKMKKEFDLWKLSDRNFIDIDDVSVIVNRIISDSIFVNTITNIASSRTYNVLDIVSILEEFTGEKAIFNLKNKGVPFDINIDKIKELVDTLELSFSNMYLVDLLNNYYDNDKSKSIGNNSDG